MRGAAPRKSCLSFTSSSNPTSEELEDGLTLLGLVGMIDPPRPEAKAAVATCRKAGIKPVMITGDHVVTASAIAKALGIMEPGDRAITGAELDAMTDDNFATIVDAVREGRGIYANIRKVVGFLLGTNIGEVITVFAAMLLWHKTPLVSMQLLWINLVTDSLPAIALGMEAVESDVMDRKPKPKDEGIFAHGLGVQVVLQGLMFALLTLIGFVVGENVTGSLAGGQTMAFMILSLSQIVQAFNMRSEHSLFRIGPFSNHTLNWAALISPRAGVPRAVHPRGHRFRPDHTAVGAVPARPRPHPRPAARHGNLQGHRADPPPPLSDAKTA